MRSDTASESADTSGWQHAGSACSRQLLWNCVNSRRSHLSPIPHVDGCQRTSPEVGLAGVLFYGLSLNWAWWLWRPPSMSDVYTDPEDDVDTFCSQLQSAVTAALVKLAPLRSQTKRCGKHSSRWLYNAAVATVADDAADVVRRRQVTAKGDAQNFEREVMGDARQQRRRLDAVTSAAIMKDDFLRLGRIQRQIVLGRPRRYVVQFVGACVDAVGRDDEVCVVCELDELVVGVERLEVGGCDGIRRWSEAGTLYNTGWYRHRGRHTTIIHSTVCVPMQLYTGNGRSSSLNPFSVTNLRPKIELM